MRLNSISAKNYRTLQDIELPFSRDYCTVSGRNNAGKSCVIRLLSGLLAQESRGPWFFSESAIDYKEDKTQWVKDVQPIRVAYSFDLTKEDDPALISFIEKIAQKDLSEPSVVLSITYLAADDASIGVEVEVDGHKVDNNAAREIEKRVQDSNLLFLYNSTTQHDEIYFAKGRRRTFFDFVMSASEKKRLMRQIKALRSRYGVLPRIICRV